MSFDGSPYSDGVVLRFSPEEAPEFAACVSLSGEHDLATQEQVAGALGKVAGNLLVDLTGCTFIDSTVIAIISARSVALHRDGYRLELVVPPVGSAVTRVLQIVGIDTIAPLHVGWESVSGSRMNGDAAP